MRLSEKSLAYRVLPTLLGHRLRGCLISRSALGGLRIGSVWRAYVSLRHDQGTEGIRGCKRGFAIVIGEGEKQVGWRDKRRERGRKEEKNRKREGDEGF